jgi:transposase InsO family protein
LRAERHWNLAQTARAFLVTTDTVRTWMRRLDEQGPDALVRTLEPVNKFPDFVASLLQRLKATCPAMGRRRAVNELARAGLHLSVTTVLRKWREQPRKSSPPPDADNQAGAQEENTNESASDGAKPEHERTSRTVTARYSHHGWNIDFSVVPTVCGFWLPWVPPGQLALSWPFCWHVAAVMDHYSRAILSYRIFRSEPSAEQLCAWLDEVVAANGRAPKYTVTDQGPQFREQFRDWCDRHAVRPRFGAVGNHGSIAILERFWSTMKSECCRRLPIVPLRLEEFETELSSFMRWYNQHRSHQGLRGATPNEVLNGNPRACDAPRFEVRARFPVQADELRDNRGVVVDLDIACFDGKRHLPIVRLKLAA